MTGRIFSVALSCSIIWHLLWAQTVRIVCPAPLLRGQFAAVTFLGSLLESSALSVPSARAPAAREVKDSFKDYPLREEKFSMSGTSRVRGAAKTAIPLYELSEKEITRLDVPAPYADRSLSMKTAGTALEQRALTYKPEPPAYPDWAKELGYEFEIELKLLILPDGRVGVVEKITSSGYPELDEIGIRYLRRWKFVPLPPEAARENQWGIIKLGFKLQ